MSLSVLWGPWAVHYSDHQLPSEITLYSVAIPEVVHNKHEINASITALLSPFWVLKFCDSGNIGTPLELPFQSQGLFHNVSCTTLIVGALYGQTKVKNMAWSRLKEEVVLTKQICKKDHNSASYNADPWMWTLFLYFSFSLVPVFPRCALRTSVWRAARHWKGSMGKYAGNHSYSNPSWRFLHDPTEKSRTKETCLSW